MIICSCSVLTDKDIRERISEIKEKNPDSTVRMSQIYKDNGKRCHSCVHRIKEIIQQS